MISLYKEEKIKIDADKTMMLVELRGLSTDEKPTELEGYTIDNGSTFVEIDTGKLYFYDLENQLWKEA